jgi:hypothetical protein
MSHPLRNPSAYLCTHRRARGLALLPATAPGQPRRARCAGLACALGILLAVLAPRPGAAEETPRPGIGENYIFNHVAEGKPESAPGQALELSLRQAAQDKDGRVLDPSSRLWAGAQAVSLSLQRAAVPLAANVIASAGDATAAAASHADGSIQLFGAGNCTSVAMPGGDPAYALALAGEGGVLAAWAQGLNRLVFFDLNAPGCPARTAAAAMRGQISLTISASGAFLAAQDESGQVWVGPRGGEMLSVATLSGAPAAIGFSEGEGVLFALDAQGRGGAWNPRTGKGLRALSVPGGPFARGDFQGAEARLWTVDGRLVRWDVLHNRPAEAEKRPGEAPRAENAGWLELRGSDLYYVRSGLSWRPAPVYEPHLPQLTVSRHADCLRLSDVDGVVRYFDARSGQERTQCFADDWTSVAIKPDGTARIPGLALRIFDRLDSPDGNGTVNARALAEDRIVLWTEVAPDLTMRVEAPPGVPGTPSPQGAQRHPAAARPAISVPLRQGLAADAPVRPLWLQ